MLVRRVTLRTLQQTLQKIGFKLTQKTISRTLARWVPLIGAAGMAAYSYYDTKCVAETAIEAFSKPIVIEGTSKAQST
jgi:arginine repressor